MERELKRGQRVEKRVKGKWGKGRKTGRGKEKMGGKERRGRGNRGRK